MRPLDPPFEYQNAYTTELYNGEVDITASDEGFPYSALMVPGDEVYVSLVSPVPVNLYVTDIKEWTDSLTMKWGIDDTMIDYNVSDGFQYYQGMSCEQTTSWNFTALSNDTAFPCIIVDPMPDHIRATMRSSKDCRDL